MPKLPCIPCKLSIAGASDSLVSLYGVIVDIKHRNKEGELQIYRKIIKSEGLNDVLDKFNVCGYGGG